MAKLLSYFDLCSISDHNEFHGLSEDKEPGTVINTLGRNTFLLIQLSNQQQVHSWNVLEKLTNKVVYDFKSQKYVAVFFNRFVRQWTSNVTDVNKVKKLKIPKPVHDLLTYQRRDTIVLYKDGTCESLAVCLDSRKDDRTQLAGQPKPIVSADDTILSAAHFQVPASDEGDAFTMLTYFVRHAESGCVELVFHKLDAETLTASGLVQRLRLARPNNVHLIGYVIVDGQSHPSLMTLWSDKRIFMMPLRFDDSTSQSNVPGNVVAMLNLFRVDQPLTIHGVGKDCVAIYGANDQQEGSSLVLYNTRFNVAQSKQFFKVYFNNARLWVIGKHIFLAYGQTLACVAYRIVREQLIDMLGSQRNNDFSTVIDRDTINEEFALEEAFRYDANASAPSDDDSDCETNDSDADEAISTVAGQQRAERVQDDLRALYDHNVLVSLNRGDVFLSDTVQTQIGSNVRDSVFRVDEIQLLAVEMEKGGAGEVEITERLVPLLIRARASDELLRCLRKYANVSDRQLVRALKYFLNMNELPEGETQTVSNVQRQELLVDERNAEYVNVVLSCSFAADQLMGHLRGTLDFSEVLCVLKHITALLGSANSGLESMVQFGDAFNEDLQLIAWFGVIVDAHYQQFVLSRNAELLGLLTKWQEYINEQIDATRNLKSLSAELYNLVNGKKPATDKQSSKWYSVEMIKMY